MPIRCLYPIQSWIWMTGIIHLMKDDSMSPVSLVYLIFDVILGHVPFQTRFMDPHGVAWPSSLTGCTLRRWHVRYLIMIPLWSHSDRSTFLGIWLLSCFLFRETFPWRLDSIWIMEIAHLTMDDLRSPDFSDLSHIWCCVGAYFRFQPRFVDPYWFAWLSPITRYALGWWFDFVLSWFSIGAFLESFCQAYTFWYSRDPWVELIQAHRSSHLHFSGVHVISLTHPHGITLELSGQIEYIWCHTGAYSLF